MKELLIGALEYYKHCLCNNDFKNSVDAINDNSSYEDHILFYYLVDALGYNKLPKIISDKDWNKLPQQEYYHGFKELEHGANYLFDFNYHYGYGSYGNGMYVTDLFNSALGYTKDDYDDDLSASQARVMPVKILTDKIIDYERLRDMSIFLFSKIKYSAVLALPHEKDKINQIQCFIDSIQDQKLKMNFASALFDETSTLALLLGYEFIWKSNWGYGVVLNREKVAISESTAKKFLTNSKKYNPNGTINFESSNK